MNKIYLFIILLFFCFLSMFSQFPAGVPKPSLWLKGEELRTNAADKTRDYFNFNPRFDNSVPNKNGYKNIFKNQYSFFAVFKSTAEEENTLFHLKATANNVEITNKQVRGINTLEYQKVNPKNGIVLSYFVGFQPGNKKLRSALEIENIGTGKGGDEKNQLMELICYPRILSKVEKQKVESYLAVKYGVSLLGETDYINSQEEKIFDFKKNRGYTSRITGIGRDDQAQLVQKQSGNSEKEGLYLAFGKIDSTNAMNKTNVADNTFLLWGDNGGAVSLKNKNKESGIQKMKRVWKIQKTAEKPTDTIPTQIALHTKEMPLGLGEKVTGDDFIWLAVSENASGDFDYTTATYYRQSEEKNGLLFFNTQNWDKDQSGSDLFTFIKAPAFFVTYDVVAPNCSLAQNSAIKLKINGGTVPYTISITSASYNQKLIVDSDSYEFAEILPSVYTMTVTDSRANVQTDVLTLTAIDENQVSIAGQWYLDSNGSVVLFPLVAEVTTAKYTFEWSQNDLVLSHEKNYEATQAGAYQLKVTNSQECSQEFKINVGDEVQNAFANLVLYPNPVKQDQPFSVQFRLKEVADADIAIYDLSGKLIKRTTSYSVKDTLYTDTVSTIGTYMIVVTINGNVQVIKLIVL